MREGEGGGRGQTLGRGGLEEGQHCPLRELVGVVERPLERVLGWALGRALGTMGPLQVPKVPGSGQAPGYPPWPLTV